MRDRLAAGPAPEVIRHLYAGRLAKAVAVSFHDMIAANKAHVVMLVRQSIVAEETGAAILAGLRELEGAGPSTVDWDPALEDLHFNIEAWLIGRIGSEHGGRLHTARSRNDLSAALGRMHMRDRLLEASKRLGDLREQVLDMAEDHTGTILTGYTHMQPGQPISLGHYLSAVAAGMEREHQRLAAAYETANLSPLGACAMAGTSFPIDRPLVADLLGFDGVLENTIDAVATRDYAADSLYALAMTGSLFSRFATDLHHWCSFEYGYLEPSDAASGTSSIMPQKKNPSALEHVKAKAAHLSAALMSALGTFKTCAYTHTREVGIESMHLVDDAFDQFTASRDLLSCSLRGLKVNRDRMRQALERNFAVATDFADGLVQEGDLPFRLAHQVVGKVVRYLVENPGTRLSGTLVLAIMAEMGVTTSLRAERLDQLAAPEVAVDRRCHLGGPAPAEVARMVARQRENLGASRLAWASKRHRLAGAEERLQAAVATIGG